MVRLCMVMVLVLGAIAPDTFTHKKTGETIKGRLICKMGATLYIKDELGRSRKLDALMWRVGLGDRPTSAPVQPAMSLEEAEAEYTRLMEAARPLVGCKTARQALVVLEKALRIKPKDAEALRLKRRCEVLVALAPRVCFRLTPKVPIRMVLIEPGTFVMGAPRSEAGWKPNEEPQHKVTISRAFYLGAFEVTQLEWKTVMGTVPWAYKQYAKESPRLPASHISWIQAMQFIDELNKRIPAESPLGPFRLPTEAEWEYACRAGGTGQYWYGNDRDLRRLFDVAWCRRAARDMAMPGGWHVKAVGQKRPNPWGLYDIHGNVAEWCLDAPRTYTKEPVTDPVGPTDDNEKREFGRDWKNTRRVQRGGDWSSGADGVRCAFRGNDVVKYGKPRAGFRLVREIVVPE